VRRTLRTLALITAAALAGCAESPSAPTRSGLAELKGSLTLTGVLRDAGGTTTGSRLIAEPDGVRVYLLSGGVAVDSTLTSKGAYTFMVPNGSYQLRMRTGPLTHATSKDFAVTSQTIFLQIESFPMASVGELSSWPNPFVSLLNTRFALATAGTVAIGVYDLANQRVRTLDAGSSYGVGSHVVGWDGKDDANQPAPDGAYWFVTSGPGHNWAELVFKEP